MRNLDFELDFFIRALTNCMEHPCVDTMFDLQRKAMSLRYSIREYSHRMEERITNNVLNAIAIKIEKDGALDEIKALKNAIDSHGK